MNGIVNGTQRELYSALFKRWRLFYVPHNPTIEEIVEPLSPDVAAS